MTDPTPTTPATPTIHQLTVEPLTPGAFAPFGSVVAPLDDGAEMTAAESVLDLSRGTPRFYVMRLEDKAPRFVGITRHRQVTQTLASVGGASWFLAVAPPLDVDDDTAVPLLGSVRAFEVPGDAAVILFRGTWHSGPFFEASSMAFFNLELSDTNVVDHQTYRLDRELGLEVELVR